MTRMINDTDDRQSYQCNIDNSVRINQVSYPYINLPELRGKSDLNDIPRIIKNDNHKVDPLPWIQQPIKAPKSYLWCHQCKKKNRNVVYCSKYLVGFCSKKYCKRCVEKHYNEDFESIDQKTWICMFCRGVCLCACCRRKRGEEVPKRIMKKKEKIEEMDNEKKDPDPNKKQKTGEE